MSTADEFDITRPLAHSPNYPHFGGGPAFLPGINQAPMNLTVMLKKSPAAWTIFAC